MKKKLLLPLLTFFGFSAVKAQVTQINSNHSLQFEYPLSKTKAIFVSNTDQTLWVSDGTTAGTFMLSPDIAFRTSLGSTEFFNGTFIFAGSFGNYGTELYITDGTIAGTKLLKDIVTGPTSSDPDDGAVMAGNLYFTATTPAEGRELWKTDGTLAGTVLVKDILPGAGSSNTAGNYEMFSNGSYLLFAAATPTNGVELWRSNGTDAGTVLLKDIYAGADSSKPRVFYPLGNTVLFAATTAAAGEEIWKTDGTPGGTVLLADINPGPASSTGLELLPGFSISLFSLFHTFNNQVFFTATDGTSTGQVWKTDGTNVTLLKNVIDGLSASFIVLAGAVDMPGKFLFSVSDFDTRNEIWESDGTPANTKLLKAFDGEEIPFLYPSFNYNAVTSTSQTVPQTLFQGKIFLSAKTAANGRELWITDGTNAGTVMVKDINSGTADGVSVASGFYTYTSAGIYFAGNNGTDGAEPWKSDGTLAGTTMVDNIATSDDSDPEFDFFVINNKVIFSADDRDNANDADLFVIDGTFSPLPVKLLDFTVTAKQSDAVLNWRTSQEINSKNYTIQRSFDGQHFESVGTVAAAGSSSTNKAFTFVDPGVVNSGKIVVYYRLLSNDVDGKSSISPIITLKLKGAGKWDVKLLTNPVYDDVKVVLSGVTQNIQLSIIDITGKKLSSILQPAVNGQVSLQTANLPHGTYTLIAESLNERKTLKFIK